MFAKVPKEKETAKPMTDAEFDAAINAVRDMNLPDVRI